MAFISVAQRHAGKQHVVLRQAHEVAHGLRIAGPVFLGAGVQAALGGQQHHRLHVHPQVRPLRRAQLAVQAEEQADGRAKQVAVLGQLPQAGRLVLARDADGGVEILAVLKPAGAEGVPEVRRIDVVLRGLAEGIGRHPGLEVVEGRAGQGVDPPGLEISPRRGAGGQLQDLAHGRGRGPVGLEGADRNSPCDSFGDVHLRSWGAAA